MLGLPQEQVNIEGRFVGLETEKVSFAVPKVTDFFSFKSSGTTLGREVVAGVTTFVTMSYIIVVNPAILKAAGIPAGPSMIATIVTNCP